MTKIVPVINQRRWFERVFNRFAALGPGTHRVDIPIDGTTLQFKAKIIEGATQVLYSFHGAVDREKTPLPVFNGFLPDLPRTHQICISDPTLAGGRGFRLGWYAGYAGFNAQLRLPQALKAITGALKPTRVTYFGNSGGGFAALYCSHHAPGSIALVGNPQTNILRYSRHLVAPYREACWPEAETNEDLANAICVDLTAIYAKGFRNTVVYCQSMGDRAQVNGQMLPFLGAIAGQSRSERVLLYSDFKGVHGHVGDRDAYREWARAIAASPTDHPKDLLDSWHRIRSMGVAPEQEQAEVPVKPASAPGFDQRDLVLTEQLRTYRQRQS